MLILQRIVSPCNPSEPFSGTHYFTTKIININKFHVTTFLPPSLAQVLFPGTLPILLIAGMLQSSPSILCKMMGKAKKEEVMRELHRNDGGMEDVVMGI
jgi:hypothetical protein